MTLLARIRRDRTMLLLILPGLLSLLIFNYVPMLGYVVAFQDYQPFLGFSESPFIGLENFTYVLTDPSFWSAVRNTIEINLLQLLLYFPAPILLALLLNSLASNRIKRLMQSVVYLPHFVSWVVIVALFQQTLGGSGFISGFLAEHGVSAFNVMTDPDLFKLLVTAQVIWKDVGWGTIIYLAALSSIDVGLYEAAAADGAGPWRRMWHITLPGIRSVTVLLLILRLGDLLSVGFEQILLQRNNVGPDAAEVLNTWVYFHGVINGDWGTGAVVGLINGLVGALLIFVANKVAHRLGEQGVYQR
ncbi:ABC transporter permease [Nonomuraea sp. NPDC003754]